jgi:SAM-dependent methyltransferase
MSCSPIRNWWRQPGARSEMADAAGERLARYYDLDLADETDDLQLYLAMAVSSSGPILELAAGTGRIALPLAAAGHAVTAVDIEPHMLDRARRGWTTLGANGQGGSLDTVEADITRLDLGQRFGLVILALNTLLLLPGRAAQLAALRAMARHLAPDGRAVVDVWLPAPDDLEIYDGRLTLDWQRTDPETSEQVAKLSVGRHDAALATARVTTFFDAWQTPSGPIHRLAREDAFSLLTSHEVLSLVESAGMRPDLVGGDYTLTPFGTGSERMVVVCGLL